MISQLKKLWKDLPPLISFHGGLVPTRNFLIPPVSSTPRQATVTGTLNDQSLGQASGYIGIFDIFSISLPPGTLNHEHG